MANDNTPAQVVVAGTPPRHGAGRGRPPCARGAKRVIALQVGGAFHSPLMRPAQAPLDAALARTVLSPSLCPVVANVDARPHTGGFDALLSAQLCSQVRWRESLGALAALGASLFVELGPGTELSGMVRRTAPRRRPGQRGRAGRPRRPGRGDDALEAAVSRRCDDQP